MDKFLKIVIMLSCIVAVFLAGIAYKSIKVIDRVSEVNKTKPKDVFTYSQGEVEYIIYGEFLE